MEQHEFQELIRDKGRELYRDMPWRRDTRPYYVLVSELMLQQTQVGRVVPKFEAFVAAYPDERALADASLADVLRLWQGLGYNRRAKYLHSAATMIVDTYGGVVPAREPELLRLPGVGRNTAGAILAYAYNQPSIFVETNIRTVYLHHFFAGRDDVRDREIIERLAATIDRDNPRQFYQSLMDYGTHLKANGAQNIARSKHYKKQSPLAGSIRQMRGQIVRQLSLGAPLDNLVADQRYMHAANGLERDGIIVQTKDGYVLTT